MLDTVVGTQESPARAAAHAAAPAHRDETMPTPLGVSPVKFGMWLFLVSEVMFFTGLLGSFIVLRFAQPQVFHEEAKHLNWMLAAANTVVLITSSFTMVLAVAAAHHGDAKKLARNMLFTLMLGGVFLGIKALEYSGKFSHGIFPGTNLFFASYFTLTGCHALHVIGGFIPMTVVLLGARRNKVNGESVELLGLYWHFVDLIWIFLFPLLYLL
jgi:cytochrome c oxidase subunit III